MKQSKLACAIPLWLVSLSICVAQESIEGHWEGTITAEGAELALSLDFKGDDQGFEGFASVPSMRAIEIPLSNIRNDPPNTHFELAGDFSINLFDGELVGDILTGSLAPSKIEVLQERFLCSGLSLSLFRTSPRKSAFTTVM